MAERTDGIPELISALRAAWAIDTTADPAGWSVENPAWGQCAVTALVVQDEFGGELLRCPAPGGSHYWNRLPDGSDLDLTREQFAGGLTLRDVQQRERAHVLSFVETRRRYEALRARLHAAAAPRAA